MVLRGGAGFLLNWDLLKSPWLLLSQHGLPIVVWEKAGSNGTAIPAVLVVARVAPFTKSWICLCMGLDTNGGSLFDLPRYHQV